MFASSWPGSSGFNPGWLGSDAVHATSSTVLGQYQRLGYAYDNGPDAGDRHHGHNVSAAELLDGTYALIVSEVVPFSVFTATSLNGPWTACSNPSGELIQKNGVNAGSDGHLDSNVTLTARPDGKFEIVQRHGLIGIASTVCGPYLLQTPTNTYPSIQQPSIASIYPNRSKHSSADPYAPGTVESTYSLAEDPVIWYSGGQYHVLYDYPDDRVGYHLTSVDGVHGWTDGGLAYDPRMAPALFGYVGSSTVNKWNKMERPGVLLENGNVTRVTWAVSDVDKNNDIPAGSNHGSKVIVVPFDGVAFDNDTGLGGGGGAAGSSGGGVAGAGGIGGSVGSGGYRGSCGVPGSGGTNPATGGTSGVGGHGTGGTKGSGGANATGGLPAIGGASSGGSTSRGDGGSGSGGSGSGGASGPAPSGTGGSANPDGEASDRSAGCSCATEGTEHGSGGNSLFVLGIAALTLVRRRRSRFLDGGERIFVDRSTTTHATAKGRRHAGRVARQRLGSEVSEHSIVAKCPGRRNEARRTSSAWSTGSWRVVAKSRRCRILSGNGSLRTS
jgi:MYXO-CTERM domain-containing protein